MAPCPTAGWIYSLCAHRAAPSTEAGGRAVPETDAGPQLPLPQLPAALRQPRSALPVAAAGTQRRVLEREPGPEVCANTLSAHSSFSLV